MSANLSRRSLAGAAALFAGASAPAMVAGRTAPHPDAALLALCAEYRAHDAAMNALTDPWMDTPGGWPADVQAEIEACAPQEHALQAAIAATPAMTLAGFKAKAAFILDRYSYYADGSPNEDDAVAWSLAQDLLTLQGELA